METTAKISLLTCPLGLPGGSVVKNPPCNAGGWVWSLGPEDPQEMTTHSSVLAWDILHLAGAVHGVAKESDTTYQLNNNMYFT